MTSDPIAAMRMKKNGVTALIISINVMDYGHAFLAESDVNTRSRTYKDSKLDGILVSHANRWGKITS